MDAIAQYKENAKQAWSTFAPTETTTGTVAPRLVRFAGVKATSKVLDVGCGTGVVAMAAARTGARVIGIDLTPALIERANEHAALTKLEIDWREGDVEALPFEDGTFDVVLSQFGHMFAPRPKQATAEMLRVLKPGGIIAFATWPPELFGGRMFQLTAQYAPPLPADVSPPVQWGDPHVVRERLGDAVKDLHFDRDTMYFQALSAQHQRLFFERNVGPISKLVQMLQNSDAAKLAQFRRELEELISLYFVDNHLEQGYLLTRATKR